jgi:hypothetical protein
VRVTISDISSFKDALLARGLAEVLEAEGLTVDGLEEISAKVSAPMTSGEVQGGKTGSAAVFAPPAVAPVAKKRGRKPGVATKQASPVEDPPRLTIRQRILDLLKGGPKTVREVLTVLNAQGLNSTHELIGQHLYLIGRDKLAVRDDETNAWSLA